jgi:hypothetical protein
VTPISLEHWNCEHCKLYNDILTNHCKACYADKPIHITSIYQVSIEFKRGIYYGTGILADLSANYLFRNLESKPMTPEEERFKEFFSHEVMLIKDMDITQLREHRIQLQSIAFEAKARTVATDDAIKTKSKDVKNKQFLVTIDQSQSDSDLLNAPKVRAARMSKIDKMRKQYLASGIDEATVNTMIANLERKGTETSVQVIPKKEFESEVVKPNPFSSKPNVIEEKINDVKPDSIPQASAEMITDSKPAKQNPFEAFMKKE